MGKKGVVGAKLWVERRGSLGESVVNQGTSGHPRDTHSGKVALALVEVLFRVNSAQELLISWEICIQLVAVCVCLCHGRLLYVV